MTSFDHRESTNEQNRVSKLIDMLPAGTSSVLDAGAWDGYISIAVAKHVDSVIALDINKPEIQHEKITPTKGDISSLDFSDSNFDLVLCSEVLEHIDPKMLEKACSELVRVSKKYILIGVPYMQDLRVGKMKCYTCGKRNPPWGHVSSFNERKLTNLFPHINISKISYVGSNNSRTNAISSLLMDWAGNPYGTYDYIGDCIYCGNKFKKPPARNLLQKIFTRIAVYLNTAQNVFSKPTASWIHILFEKESCSEK